MTARGECDIALSRGVLREGLAALEAFGDLLGLRRVGPRALDRAKSDTCDACTSLVAALEPFERTLVVALGKTPEAESMLRALGERIRSHVAPIAEALRDPAPISARRRLALETVFRKHRSEFKDCLTLCELVVAAVTTVPVELDVLELFENVQVERIVDTPVIRVGIDVVRSVPFCADRHVLMGLVEAAATFVCQNGSGQVRLIAGTNDAGASMMRLTPAPRGWVMPKKSIVLPMRGQADLAVDVARVVAARTGLGVAFDSAALSASIVTSPRGGPC